ncbi:hypothetical protein AMOR_38850 [Anaeromyxobacter oryzae]|uniref:Uncharacterized protein n=1 Tax=Anaeromyxobacter oryzae TaxID=2918170 RepID=A0ABN6MYK5_9BACT|nr:hypothetical protein AMOR_38850 [Anaeromyxobacter oryzae]
MEAGAARPPRRLASLSGPPRRRCPGAGPAVWNGPMTETEKTVRLTSLSHGAG